MNVLVINSGSSSIKYQLLETVNNTVLSKGLLERIGIPGSIMKHRKDSEKFNIERPVANHDEGLRLVLEVLTDPVMGVLKDLKDIDAVGHRVVHGGEKFSGSVRVDDEVIKALEENAYLAPLHNPPNIMGIKSSIKLLPGIPNVAVFDTSFHASIPDFAYLYAIPLEYYRKFKIRRYGFHGTSHRYVSKRAAEILGKKVEEMKIISCHLGNGASVAAVKYGKSVDTSMGFTPLEGLVMGTRSGDIDPSITIALQEKEGMSAEEVYSILNKKSGILGLTDGFSSDMRDIEDKATEKDPVCRRALDVYIYRIAKYIGAYAAVMNGVDAIIFTAGVGENSPILRQEVCEKYLGYLGVEFNESVNDFKGEERIISKENSKVKVLVVTTNEELVIAQDTKDIVEGGLKSL